MARPPKKKPSASQSPRGKSAASGKPAARTSPLDPRVRKAQAAWENREFDLAIRLYEQALERAPTSAVLLVDVARAYALRYRFADAEELMARACAVHAADAELQRMLGRTYLQLQQYDRAIECFRRSLELEPESPKRAETLYELTRMYERLHRLDEARQCAEESLALAPRQPILKYLLGLVARRTGDVDEAEARFQEVAASEIAKNDTVANALYELASIYDKQGRFAEAYDAACQAKRVLDKTSAPYKYDAADVARTAGRTIATTTADYFARWGAQANQFKRLGGGLALLTSHPRSGTTLLEQVLDAHPALISADELQVMADLVYLPLCRETPSGTPVAQIMDEAPNQRIAAARGAYWQAMEGALRQPIGDRILLDKNPALTGLLPIVARVFPEMKILFALRDPRDVVVSCFMQQLPLNAVSVNYLTLEQTAAHYAATMRGWLKFRPLLANPWIEIRYEDVVADVEREARRALDFLGLPWDEGVLAYRRRAQEKHVHSPTYEAVTKPLYSGSIGRWRNYAAQLEPSLSTLQPYIDAFGYNP